LNKKQHENFISTYGDAYLNSLEWVDPDEIQDFNQKARINGNQQNNIARYTSQFLNGTEQEVPISLRANTCMDGTTRLKAKQAVKKVDKNQKVLVSRFQQKVLQFSDDEWEDFQDSANDHLGDTPATDADMEGATLRRINNGRIFNIVNKGRTVPLDPEKNSEDLEPYANAAAKYMKEDIYPRSARTERWFYNRIEKALSKPINQKLGRITYSVVDNVRYYRDSQHSSWDGADSKAISYNEHLIVINSKSRFDPNVSGVLTQQFRDNPGVKQTIAISLSNLNGMTDSDVKKTRKDIVESVKKTLKVYKNTPEVSVVIFRQLPGDRFAVVELYNNHHSVTATKNFSVVE